MDNNVAQSIAPTPSMHLGPPLVGSAPDYQGHSVTVHYARPCSPVPPVFETTSDMSLAARMAIPAGSGQPRTGASLTASTATDADCTATESTAASFSCQIDSVGTVESEFFFSHFSNEVGQLSHELHRMVLTRDEVHPMDSNVALSIAQGPSCRLGPPLVGSAPDDQSPSVAVQHTDRLSPLPPVFEATNDMSLAIPPGEAPTPSMHLGPPLVESEPDYRGDSVTVQYARPCSPVPPVFETTSDMSLAARMAIPAGSGQPRAGASLTASTATGADCKATESTAPHFLCQIDGAGRTFESLPFLIAEPELLGNFRRNFFCYFDDEVAQLSDYKLQEMIITRDEVKRAFLLCNRVEQTTQTSVDRRSGSQANPLFNPLMNTCGRRLLSMTLHDAARQSGFFDCLPRGVRNIMNLSDEGLYLSYAQLKLFCFSCGGAFERWNQEWHNYSIREVHARIFPSCRFVSQQYGTSFITDCRQKVAPGPHNDGPDPLATHPHLYRLPITEAELRDEFTSRMQLSMAFMERTPPVVSRSPFVREQNALAEMDRQVQVCLKRLDEILNDPPVQLSLSKLRTRVCATANSVDMMATMLKILQDLLDMPSERLPAVVGEVVQIIDAILEHDCQDHTSEVLDQITTRMAFVRIHQKMVKDSSLSVLDLLEQLKLLFNESVLYQLLTKTRMNGAPLIAHPESVEIRAFLKNEFARTVCDFHSNTVHQIHPYIGAQSRSRMLVLTEAFKEGISNCEHFKSYLFKLFKTDTSFVNFLKLHDEEFATMLGTSESGAELLMELYSSSNSSEQEVLTNTTNLAATREEFLLQDLECFLGEYVRHYWEAIVNATSR